MRIAVTGGAGFIGSHVVDHLVAAGHEVAVLDVRPPHRADVQFFDVDILDLPGLVRATRGCDVIFHLAGVADVNHAKAHPVLTAELNVAGTAKVWSPLAWLLIAVFTASVLGWAWSLLNPLGTMAIFTLVFKYFFRIQATPGHGGRQCRGRAGWPADCRRR